MKSVLKFSIPSSIISDSNWENLEYIELQPNLAVYLQKNVFNKRTFPEIQDKYFISPF